MSAMGQKRTFAVQNGMSALLPKADFPEWRLQCSLWATRGHTQNPRARFWAQYFVSQSDCGNGPAVIILMMSAETNCEETNFKPASGTCSSVRRSNPAP